MAEQRLRTKAADYTSPNQDGGGELVATHLLPVEGSPVRVFGIAAVHDPREDVAHAVNRVLRTHLERTRDAIAQEANVPRRFETLLADINAAFADVHDAFPTLALANVEAIVGVMTERQLFLSGFGALNALFLHKTAERRFVIYELHAQFAAEAEATWDKAFVTILDGELHPGDILYIATRVPNAVLRLGDLQDILVTLPPAGALERVQQFLPHDLAYGALCFHVAEEEKAGPPKKANPIASLAQLGHTKAETADLLGEQGTDVTGFVRRAVSFLSSRLAAPGSRGYKSMLKRLARFALQFLGAVLIALIQFLRWLARTIAKLIGRILQTSGSADQPAYRRLTNGVAQRVAQVRGLPPAAKYAGGGAVALVIVLIIAVNIMQGQAAKRREEASFVSAAATIEEKATAAEASLVYNDSNKAYALLTEAAALLEALPTDGRAHEARVEELRAMLTATQAKIRKETAVTLTTIATLPEGEVALGAFTAAADGTLYGVGKDGDLFRVNELERSVAVDIAASGSLSGIRTVVGENGNILVIDSDKRLGRADTAAKTLRPIASGVEGMASAEDAFVYNDALYVLSAASQQIVKMRPQGDGYEGGTPWISNRSSDLTGARAIAIDGALFVLTATDIVQYKSGKEVTWAHSPIDPALKDPIDIWTNVDSAYLYVLDKGTGRIVVYNKTTGDIVIQYTASELAQAVGFVVREATNDIVIATGTTVATFTATHLLQ